MGQAKRRGTYEERVKQAHDRDVIARQKANEEYWKKRVGVAGAKSLIGLPDGLFRKEPAK